jgi:hypothetical protein
VTEEQWRTCTDPAPMFEALRASAKASDRKLRLFAVACCRRITHLLADAKSREAIEAGELLAGSQHGTFSPKRRAMDRFRSNYVAPVPDCGI